MVGRKKIRLVCVGALACLCAAELAAAPAAELWSEVAFEDRSTRRARARGDERFNWVEDEDGFALAPGASGRWQYARREAGRWVAAGLAPQQRGLEARRGERAAAAAPSGARPSGAASGAAALSAGAARGGVLAVQPPPPVPLLVLQVSFSDRADTYAASVWSNACFGAAGKTVNTYFRQASNGRFWYTQPAETQGAANDGVISVTLSTKHPNTTSWVDALRTAVKSALIAADAHIDFGAYDADGNGALSHAELQLVLVFAGYEAAYNNPPSPKVWAHQWSLYGSVPAPALDGVAVGGWPHGYSVVGEIHYNPNHPATIGIICHELGHNLGLIDLYDTDYSSDGVGYHCLMGLGNWGRASGDSYLGQSPVLPCAYQRLSLGFSDARVAAGLDQAYALAQASDQGDARDVLLLPSADSNQYFLVENRQLAGFDAGLYASFGVSSGGGLAVWHVDEGAADNNADARRRVDLEEAADASLDVPGGNQGRLKHYFYAGNRTLFNAATAPGSALYGGAASLAAVSNVSASAAQMTCRADAGANPLPSRATVISVR